jgi:hypothetical protein
MDYTNLFYTKNSDHAALLIALNQTLDYCYRDIDGEVNFVFVNEFVCKNLLKNYFHKNQKVNANALFDAIKSVQQYVESV